jgi:VWFA-related protein
MNSGQDFRRSSIIRLSFGFLALFVVLSSATSSQQASPTASSSGTQSAPQKASSQEPASEMAVKDEATTSKVSDEAKFRVNVRLVLVRVVVRDSTGHAVGNLRKEDFQLFDNGKPQVISNFDAQNQAVPPAATTPVTSTATSTQPASSSQTASPPVFPGRYIAYLFDDLLLNFGDLVRVRDAALKRIATLGPADRIGIFSSSGQTVLDFSDDRAKLTETLGNLRSRPLQGNEIAKCPDISFYMADMIVNKRDQNVLQTAANDYIRCANLPQQQWNTAPSIVETMASQVFNVDQESSRMSLRVLHDVVRRMAALPGQRTLVLVSPGFLTPQLEYEYSDLIDRAVRTQVVISSLDARGLYVVVPYGGASERGHPDELLPGEAYTPTPRIQIDQNSATAESDILAVLANGTGGVFFQNNNDMDEGFRRVADSPEFYYILGFTPQSLKSDGKYHSLKVGLTNHQKYDVQARRGYYAPRKDLDAAEEAKQEINDEVFSSEELHDLPVALHTEFFKPSDDSAKLTVLARVDVKRLHYKQSNDRNNNELTIVTAVFDRNGNFIQADQKLVQMRWKNETLQAKLTSGITLKTSFDVKPGRYLVRVVARDSEQQVMSAENGAVEIP